MRAPDRLPANPAGTTRTLQPLLNRGHGDAGDSFCLLCLQYTSTMCTPLQKGGCSSRAQEVQQATCHNLQQAGHAKRAHTPGEM